MNITPIIVTYVLYFTAVLLIGYFASRVTRNLSDYVLGGRNLNGPIAALGAGASDMSGWLLLALPGAVYLNGLQEIWMPVALALGAYFNWFFVAKRLRVYTEVANNSLTIPAYLDNRFLDPHGVLRTVTALVILVFFTFYSAAGFVGCAVLFKTTFNLDYSHALFISSIFLVIYTCIGGFLAVSWVDFLQGSLMLFALLIVPFITLKSMGGWNITLHTLQQIKPTNLHWIGINGWIDMVSLMAWGIGYFGQPHILVRFMAVQKTSMLPLARRICMNWMVLCLTGAILTGFVGSAYFAKASLADPNSVFIVLSQRLFHPWVVGILLAAVLSAIMSTIAAQLLACSSSLTEDLYHRFIRRHAHQKELVLVSRLTVVFIAGIAVALAYHPNSSLLNLVGYAWAGLGASFGPLILFSLFWPGMTRNGAVAGIIAGAAGVIVWQSLDYHLGGIFKLYEILPAFILSAIIIVVVSLLDKPPHRAIREQFETVQKQLSSM